MSKTVISNGKKVLKNIAIAVATTVIGSTAIYFMGLNNKKKLSFLDRQEITSDAWKSYASIENIYTKNSISLLQEALQYGKYQELYKQSVAESDKLKNSIDEFIQTEGVDKELVNLLKKRLKTEKESRELAEVFYTGLEKLKSLGTSVHWSEEQAKDTVTARANRYISKVKELILLFLDETSKMAVKLSEKYELPFETTEFLVLQAERYGNDIFDLGADQKKEQVLPQADLGGKKIEQAGDPATFTRQYLIGKWNQDGNTIRFSRDGKISWLDETTGKTANGKWQLKKDKLIIDIKDHPVTGENGTGQFDISNVLSNSFTMQLTGLTKDFYHLERI